MARVSSSASCTGHHSTAILQSHRPVLLALLLLAGCRSPAPQPPPSTASTPTSEPAAPPAPFVATPAPLRRLTNEEYNNSVRDLLGDTSRPAESFPPDEVVGGFENNTIAPVTQALVERYMGAAEGLAAAAAKHLEKLAPCPTGEPQEACAGRFIASFGRLAFRRPLEQREQAALLSLYTEKQKRSDYQQAIQLVIEAILQSPRFLYRLEPATQGKNRQLDGYELATRLSYYIWASTPDAALLDAAEAGKLSTAKGVEEATRRLLKDPRATTGIRSFHRQWLDLRELETASKDAELYPMYSPELKAAMVEETLRFSSHAVLEGSNAITELLTSRKTFVNAPLAKLYGVTPPPGGGFSLIELPKDERAGLLTQASVMAVHASAEQTSPILRGKFVREKLLCQIIPPPPPGAVVAAPKFDPKLTKKEQFARHQKDMSCAGCHQMMDPIGFGFEHYDALGAWRTVEGAFQIDSVGKLALTDDVDGDFDGAIALAERLSQSQQVRRCVATQWFRAALGRVERDEDAAALEKAYQMFLHTSYDVRELIVAITTSDSFRHTGPEEGNAP